MSQRKAKFKGFDIEVELYRLHVVVTWEKDIKNIISHGRRGGIRKSAFSRSWQDDFNTHREEAVGVCMEFGDGTHDILVWLKKKPKVASEYGVLYHELYHAVDMIADNRAIKYQDIEPRAYLFEFLVNQSNARLWPARRG